MHLHILHRSLTLFPDIAAAEKKEAHGRYLVTSERGIPQIELVEALRQSGKFTQYKLPTKELIKAQHSPLINVKKTREELGVQFTPLQQTVVGACEDVYYFILFFMLGLGRNY